MFDKNLWREAKKEVVGLILSLVFGLGRGILVIVQAWYISLVVSRVFLSHQALPDVRSELNILIAVVVGRAVSSFGGEVASRYLAINIKRGLRERLFTHLFELGPTVLEGERSGELTNTLVDGIEKLTAYFSQYLPQLAMAAIIPVTILTAVFPLDILTGIVFLVTAPLIPFFMVLIGKQAEKETQRQWKFLSRLSAHFLDILQGLTTLKNLGQSRNQEKEIASVSDEYAEITLGVLRIAFLSALTLELIATLSTAVVAVEIGLRLMYGKFIFQYALFILILAPEYYMPLRQLGVSFHAGMEGISAADRIFSLLNIKPISPPTVTKKVSLPIRRIDFQNISFAYQAGERPSLHEVSFSLVTGQRMALVGKSGSGKSTIASLLLGFVRPDSGGIKVDGINLNQLEMEDWRQYISWVPQFPYVFHDTVEANLRIAKPDATQEEIKKACEKANLIEVIETLPERFQTIVGEKGAFLSGGQAQRLAIARAFLKDSAILILDEPASNLDTILEEQILTSMKALMGNKTVLILAHRMLTAQSADRIFVLDQGRVVEQGGHEELVRIQGRYYNLVSGGLR